MFARVAVYEIPGHRAGEAVNSFREATDQIRQMNPREVYVLVSPESDRAMTVTLWDRHDDMEASRMAASRLRSEAANVVEGSVQSVVEYEVAIHEKAEPDL